MCTKQSSSDFESVEIRINIKNILGQLWDTTVLLSGPMTISTK